MAPSKTQLKSKNSSAVRTSSKQIKEEGLFLGTVSNKPFFYPQENLKKHFIALGASGSGKTVLSKVLLEEAALAKVPSIVVDVQGDLCALALEGDDEVLIEKGLDEKTIKRFRENVEVTIFTPISSKGIPLCINPLQLDQAKLPEAYKRSERKGENVSEHREIIPILHSIASSFCKLLGYNTSNDKGKFAEAIIYTILKYSYEEKEAINNFEDLTNLIKQPSAQLKKKMSAFINEEKEVDTLVRKIQFMNVGEKKLLFQYGVPVNIDLLLGKKSKSGKTQMSIIYMNTLPDQEDKEFFLAALTTKFYQWMLDNPAKKLQALYMIDEIAPFIPAGARKPMPKDILKMMFKQARKYGIGCVIATQNPGDIDYKAFAQFGTWALGRLSLKQDIKKVDQALSSFGSSDDVKSKLPKLQAGEFVLFAPDISKKLLDLKTRWLITEHATLDEDEIKDLMADSQEKYKPLFVREKKSKKEKSPIVEEYEDKLEDDNEIEEIFEEKVNKVKKDGTEYECFPGLSDDEVFAIAEKKKKRSLMGPGEQIVDINKHNHPIIFTRVRQVKKKLLGGKKEEQFFIFFDGVTGEIITVKPKRHEHIIETRNLIGNSENQLYLARSVMKSKNEMSITELAHKTGLDERTASKNLKSLTDIGVLTFRREGKYKYFSSLQTFNSSLKKLDSEMPELVIDLLDDVIDYEITSNDISTFIRTWFENAQVLETKLLYVPLHEIIYSKKGKTRTVYINGTTRQVV